MAFKGFYSCGYKRQDSQACASVFVQKVNKKRVYVTLSLSHGWHNYLTAVTLDSASQSRPLSANTKRFDFTTQWTNLLTLDPLCISLTRSLQILTQFRFFFSELPMWRKHSNNSKQFLLKEPKIGMLSFCQCKCEWGKRGGPKTSGCLHSHNGTITHSSMPEPYADIQRLLSIWRDY